MHLPSSPKITVVVPLEFVIGIRSFVPMQTLPDRDMEIGHINAEATCEFEMIEWDSSKLFTRSAASSH